MWIPPGDMFRRSGVENVLFAGKHSSNEAARCRFPPHHLSILENGEDNRAGLTTNTHE